MSTYASIAAVHLDENNLKIEHRPPAYIVARDAAMKALSILRYER
jgi:hypothetical protein